MNNTCLEFRNLPQEPWLALDPTMLIGLDPVSQQDVVLFLQQIVEEIGLAVLLVSHDRDLAERVSTRLTELGGAHGQAA